jgi:hypothetical protein
MLIQMAKLTGFFAVSRTTPAAQELIRKAGYS